MKPLGILIATILTGLAPIVAVAEPWPQRDVTRKLMASEIFAFGNVFRGGNISAGEKLFRQVLQSRNALEVFREILQRGTRPAKLYALGGIRALAPSEFDQAAGAVTDTEVKVRTLSGCIVRSREFSDVVRELREGRFDEYLRKK